MIYNIELQIPKAFLRNMNMHVIELNIIKYEFVKL